LTRLHIRIGHIQCHQTKDRNRRDVVPCQPIGRNPLIIFGHLWVILVKLKTDNLGAVCVPSHDLKRRRESR